MTYVPRILIADDEPTFLHSTADLLRREGYACVSASDAGLALQALQVATFDLLISDIHMPGNEKMELFRELAWAAPEIPVLLVTGYADLISAMESLQVHVVGRLVKPFEFAELLGQVRRATEGMSEAPQLQGPRDLRRRGHGDPTRDLGHLPMPKLADEWIQDAAQARSPVALARRLLSRFLEVCAVGRGAFFLESTEGKLRLAAAYGFDRWFSAAFGAHAASRWLLKVAAHREESFVPLTECPDPIFRRVSRPRSHDRLAIFPLFTAERRVGVLCLVSESPEPWRPARLHVISTLARLSALLIEQSHLREAISREERTLRDLSRTAQLVHHGESLESILSSIVRTARQIVGAGHAALGVGDDGNRLKHFVWDSIDPQMAKYSGTLPRGLGLLGLLLRETGPVRVDDLTRHAEHHGFPTGHVAMKSFLGIPLVHRGRTLGSFYMADKINGGTFSERDEELLSAFASEVALVVENALLWAKLEDSRRRFEDLFDNAPDMYHTTNLEGLVLACNHTEAAALGRPKEEIVGLKETDLFALESQETLSFIRRRVSAGKTSGGKLVMRRKDGSTLEVTLRSRPVRDREGRIVEVRTTLRDLTETRSLEKQVYTMQKKAAMGQLAAGLAHELRNLLTAISGHTELAAEKSVDAAVLRHLSVVRNEVERGRDLTKKLLAYAGSSGRLVTAIDLNELVKAVVEILTPMLSKHLDVELCLEPTLPPVEGDAGQLYQLLINLCMNARDAMPDGGCLRLRTALFDVGGEGRSQQTSMLADRYVCVAVSDTGVGMTPDVKARIFEPFFTTKPTSGGAGLGLAAVYGIVKSHNGYIEVDSEPGKGSDFRVYLPPSLLTADAGPSNE